MFLYTFCPITGTLYTTREIKDSEGYSKEELANIYTNFDVNIYGSVLLYISDSELNQKEIEELQNQIIKNEKVKIEN